MATSNVSIDQDWTLVVSASTASARVTCTCCVEFAVTVDDSTAPVVMGHVMERQEGVISGGPLWIRTVSESSGIAVVTPE
jgi:hypothetical protein